MGRVFILSNNPLVWQHFPQCVKVEGALREVLVKARDYIHQGHRLVNHPLTGSIKPNEISYKSLVLTSQAASLDCHSLQLIEAALETVDKFAGTSRTWGDKVEKDFQFIDYTLLLTSLELLSPDLAL